MANLQQSSDIDSNFENLHPYIGSYERIIGRSVYVKVRNKYVSGRVAAYFFRSQKYGISCADGKYRRVDSIYIRN